MNLVQSSVAVVSHELAVRYGTRALALAAVRKAFAELAAGESVLFPVAMGQGPDAGSAVNIKAGRAANGVTGLKAGTYWPHNRSMGLPNHSATTLLLDPATGRLCAIVNVAAINPIRTAAADALAVDHLARKDADTLAIVGTGAQAASEVRAIHDVRPLRALRLWNRTPQRARDFADALGELEIPSIEICETADDAVCAADIVVTATTSREPLFRHESLRPGTHISAMGTDRPGKQELPLATLARASLFADHPVQSVQIGEFQHLAALGEGVARVRAIGDVVLGREPGRSNDTEITCFDSSGVAAQDIAVAAALVDAARAAGDLLTINF